MILVNPQANGGSQCQIYSITKSGHALLYQGSKGNYHRQTKQQKRKYTKNSTEKHNSRQKRANVKEESPVLLGAWIARSPSGRRPRRGQRRRRPRGIGQERTPWAEIRLRDSENGESESNKGRKGTRRGTGFPGYGFSAMDATGTPMSTGQRSISSPPPLLDRLGAWVTFRLRLPTISLTHTIYTRSSYASMINRPTNNLTVNKETTQRVLPG